MNPAEAFSSFASNIKERAINPLFGSFLSAWLVCNWKVILYLLFAKAEIEVKIIEIENNMLHIENMLVYPLIFSVIYILLFQWVNVLISRWLFYLEKLKLNAITESEINKAELYRIKSLRDPKRSHEYIEIEQVIKTVLWNASDADKLRLAKALQEMASKSEQNI